MTGMVDMHCHIIPGVDDGAASKSEMRKLLKMEYDSGVRILILTPHHRKGIFEASKELIEERAKLVEDEIKQMNLDMKVYLGCEYHANIDMIADLQANPHFRINGGRYVLVEFQQSHPKTRIRNWIYELLAAGYRPIVAHVERYPKIVRDVEFMEELLELGVLLQVDASAIIGKDGWRMKRISGKLLKKRYIHFIGSDTHEPNVCYPNLDVCSRYVEKKMGRAYAEELFIMNPQKLLVPENHIDS